MIRVEGLSFGYGRAALYETFDLHLREPGVYGLFGRNGSGKSTLLKLLSGLLFPRRGRITVHGHSPRKRHPDFLEKLMFVPEEFHLPDLSPAQLQRTHGAFYPHFSAEAFQDYLDVFELDAGRRFGEMSLGQKKKAVVAFALATFTPVLLLDEPTNGMDIVGREKFRSIMARPEQRERAVIIGTHQAHDLEQIMNHILFVDSATLVLSASVQQLASAMTMGVVANESALSGIHDLIYSESLGDQVAYVARSGGQPPGGLSLELIYKALSRNHAGVISAVRETGHV